VLDPPKLPAETPADGSPKADSPATGSGVLSTLKGGSDPSANVERKPSLKKTAATYSRVDSGSRMTVACQEVVEEHDPVQDVVEASHRPEEGMSVFFSTHPHPLVSYPCSIPKKSPSPSHACH
jgi:hypothetical protein